MDSLKKILEYKDQTDFSSVKKLGELMFERMFSPKDLGINYRTIVHWDEKGILSYGEEKKEPNKWRNFSFMEVIWVDFVDEVRSMGYTLPQVLLLKKQLFDPYSPEIFLKRFQLNSQANMSKTEKKVFKGNEAELQRAENFKTVKPEKMKFKQKVNALSIPILYFLADRQDTTFHIYADGTFEEFNSDEEIPKDLDWKRTHISISMSKIMQKYLHRDKDLENEFSLAALSNDELTVLYYLRKGDLKSLSIYFDKKNSIQLLETKEEKSVDTESRFLEHILKNGYHEISFKTQAGKITTFERITKHKIKK